MAVEPWEDVESQGATPPPCALPTPTAEEEEKNTPKAKKNKKENFSSHNPSSLLFAKQKFAFSIVELPPEFGPGFFGMFPNRGDSQFVKMTTKICKLKTPFEMQRRFVT